jgi:hypothetical protein
VLPGAPPGRPRPKPTVQPEDDAGLTAMRVAATAPVESVEPNAMTHFPTPSDADVPLPVAVYMVLGLTDTV